MTESIVRRGVDAWVGQSGPNTEHPSTRRIALNATGGSQRRGFLHMPLKGIRGRTILSATLTAHVAGTWAAQTISVQRVANDWEAATLNWDNQRNVLGSIATAVTGALADGDEFDVDVTTMIQQVANGVPWYGFRIVTDETASDQYLWAFESGKPSWRLTIEISERPEQPTGLTPADGAVSSSKPILSWDFTDLGGTSTEQAAFQVQIDPAADEVSPDFDSTEVASTEPEYDLTGSAYAGLADAASTQWRVRVKDAAGLWSEWSDWVEFSREDKPVLTLDQPATGLVYDPTPPIEASITGGTLASWRIRITHGTDRTRVLYNSGLRDATHATDIALTLPLRNPNTGRRIFVDDTTYQVNVRAWDDVDRAEGVTADPTYVEVWDTFTFDDDAAVEAPAALAVTQLDNGPRLKFQCTRSVNPDAFLITDAGKFYARIPAAQFPEVAGVYEWTDSGFSDPGVAHNWRVRAIVNNRKSDPSNLVTLTTQVEAVWLITANGATVMLSGIPDVDRFAMLDRRATYKPPNLDHDVDILYSQEGVSGSYSGTIYQRSEQDVAAALVVLQAIKDDRTTPVQLVWANKSVPAILRDLTFLPASDYFEGTFEGAEKHNVSFGFGQVGDFDVEDA